MAVGYVAMLVGYDKNTKEIVYGAIEVVAETVPENDSETIMEVVRLANKHPDLDDDVEYIDMYGYSYMGDKVFWEVAGTEKEFGGLHYE